MDAPAYSAVSSAQSPVSLAAIEKVVVYCVYGHELGQSTAGRPVQTK